MYAMDEKWRAAKYQRAERSRVAEGEGVKSRAMNGAERAVPAELEPSQLLEPVHRLAPHVFQEYQIPAWRNHHDPRRS